MSRHVCPETCVLNDGSEINAPWHVWDQELFQWRCHLCNGTAVTAGHIKAKKHAYRSGQRSFTDGFNVLNGRLVSVTVHPDYVDEWPPRAALQQQALPAPPQPPAPPPPMGPPPAPAQAAAVVPPPGFPGATRMDNIETRMAALEAHDFIAILDRMQALEREVHVLNTCVHDMGLLIGQLEAQLNSAILSMGSAPPGATPGATRPPGLATLRVLRDQRATQGATTPRSPPSGTAGATAPTASATAPTASATASASSARAPGAAHP